MPGGTARAVADSLRGHSCRDISAARRLGIARGYNVEQRRIKLEVLVFIFEGYQSVRAVFFLAGLISRRRLRAHDEIVGRVVEEQRLLLVFILGFDFEFLCLLG